ncbi:FadR/GntR family transcriptional regulator [Demetria terragena]|uniref:FadR/GntR family transcriptional regulator n=1 Tax=Demetria terragena TaxID=63959 RepID=UPI0003A789E0|nr:FadR/GntR family transcriptional regulator [Demetria terragena]
MAVTDEAISGIKDMIASGQLRPGGKLPREADLAERLGLSRNSLREAVRALSLIHVLDVRQGDGTYVTSLEPSLLMSGMQFVVDLHQDDTVLQFFEVRSLLEPSATALAAERMSDEAISELRDVLDSIPANPGVEQLVSADLVFHRRIAEGAENVVLHSMLEGLTGPMQRARVWRGLTETGAVARTIAEHRAILDAIADRRPEAARAWATVHIAGVEGWLLSNLRDGADSVIDPLE